MAKVATRWAAQLHDKVGAGPLRRTRRASTHAAASLDRPPGASRLADSGGVPRYSSIIFHPVAAREQSSTDTCTGAGRSGRGTSPLPLRPATQTHTSHSTCSAAPAPAPWRVVRGAKSSAQQHERTCKPSPRPPPAHFVLLATIIPAAARGGFTLQLQPNTRYASNLTPQRAPQTGQRQAHRHATKSCSAAGNPRAPCQ